MRVRRDLGMISDIGIHSSVDKLFPPDVLREALSDGEQTVRVLRTNEALAECDALVTFEYAEGFLSADLTWIHSIQSGVDRIPVDELAAHEIRLTNSAGIHGDSVGETVAGYMLMFARGLHRHRTNQTKREWSVPEWDSAFTLHGKSLCVVGLGTLGRGIATRADALGMDVVGVKRTPTPVEHVDVVYTPANLHEAIDDAQFVALAVPLTDQTTGLMADSEFEVLRDDAYLINVARGDVVDQSALVASLESDALAGAAL